VTSPHPAVFGRARPRARPSARRRRRLPSTCWATAAAPYRAGSSSGHGELRGGGHSQRPHKGSAASLKHCRSSWVLTASPTEVRAQIVPGLEAFNHVRNVKPGPERSEGPLSKDRARTGHSQRPHKAPSQRIGRELEASNPLPLYPARTRNAVRVPAASLKHCRSSWVLTASPTEVRAQVVPGLEASTGG